MESAYEKTNQIGEGTYGQVCAVLDFAGLLLYTGASYGWMLLPPLAEANSVTAKTVISIAEHV